MKQTGTLRNIISVTFWKSVGLGLSLLIALAIANFFGAGAASDAFFMARRVVSNIAAAVERTFQFLQVPPLVRMAETKGLAVLARHLHRRNWQIFAAAALICAVLFALAPQLARALAPGFDASQHAAATTYLRILLAVLPLSAATALSGATLNALRLFRVPVIARLLPRVFAAAALMMVPLFAFGLGAVTWAIASGTVVMAAVFALSIRRALAQGSRAAALPAARTSPALAPETAEPAAGALPAAYSRSRILAMLLAQIHLFGAGWIDMAMASLTGAGGVATLEFAQRMTNMTPGVVTSSVIIVYYTEFASHLAGGRTEAFRRSVQDAMRATLLFVMPAAVLLWMLNKPLVSLLLGHGAFEPWAVQQTAGIISVLAPLLVINALTGTLASALFADPGLPHLRIVATGVAAAIVIRLLLNWWLLPVLGVLAVPVAALCAITVLLLIFYFQLTRAFGPILRLQEAGPFAAMAAASAAAMAVIWLLTAAAGPGPGGRAGLMAGTALSAFCGGLAFALTAAWLKVPELAAVHQRLRRILQRARA